MREIKFRAWDKKSKKIRVVDSIAFHGYGTFDSPTQEVKVVNMWGKDIINDKHIIIHRDIKDVELMQYTGLKDKNGKEIFKSDIVKGFENKYIVRIDICPDNGLMSVFLENTEKDFTTYQLKSLNDFEIIGNIYENKNLIE